MPSPRTPQEPEPEGRPGTQLPHDRVPAARPRANLVMRIQMSTGGYAARHPKLLRVMQWLGWNNPGGSMNP